MVCTAATSRFWRPRSRPRADPVAVVTFDPHPRAVLGPPKRARLLTPLDERLELLAQWPVAAAVVLRFDQRIAALSYVDFVRDALLGGLGARRLVLGHNFRLGHERRGDRDSLTALGRDLGYEVTFVPAVVVGGEPVSSTRIRHRLDAGDVEAAADLLGRPYTLSGTVVRGSGRGRGLGIPTANLLVHADKLVPATGVYAVRARVGSVQFPGALNIGVQPTFQAAGAPAAVRSIEVHLLDYTGDLYGASVRLELVAHLRDERRFAGADELVQQVQRDLDAVRALGLDAPARSSSASGLSRASSSAHSPAPRPTAAPRSPNAPRPPSSGPPTPGSGGSRGRSDKPLRD
jgi:riboflavin kinase / FMN adenylyltransferase